MQLHAGYILDETPCIKPTPGAVRHAVNRVDYITLSFSSQEITYSYLSAPGNYMVGCPNVLEI